MARYLYSGPPTVISVGDRDIPLSPGCHFEADVETPYIKRLVARDLAKLVADAAAQGVPFCDFAKDFSEAVEERYGSGCNGDHACGDPGETVADPEPETEPKTGAEPKPAPKNRRNRQ